MAIDLVCVDFADRGTPAFARTVAEALASHGFFQMRYPGVRDVLPRAWKLIRAVLEDLSEQQRLVYRREKQSHQRGYGPIGCEHAKDSKVADNKKFWMVRDPEQSQDPENNPFGPNVFPMEVPEFEPVMLELFGHLLSAGRATLEAIETTYGLEPGQIVNLTRGAENMLRPILYPAVKDVGALPPDTMRSARHEDINLVTVLPRSLRPGLQILLDGEWHDVNADPGNLIVDNGDMLCPIPGLEELRPTTHRVTMVGCEEARIATPCFVHARHSAWLNSTTQVGPWLRRRLKAIGN